MEREECASGPLAGGVMQQGYQCGMLWGSVLAAGAEAYRRHGPGPKAESAAIAAAGRLLEPFRARFKSTNCLEITDTDWTKKWDWVKNFIKGGPIVCFRMAAKYGPAAFHEIGAALSEEPGEVPPAPVSCASVLAGKMGASELHQTMVSGFAGGIGLSGGGCGALGAAVWIESLGVPRKAVWKEIVDTGAHGVMDRFLKKTEYVFECEKIAGKKFESVAEHAGYVAGGGCSELIEVLVEKSA